MSEGNSGEEFRHLNDPILVQAEMLRESGHWRQSAELLQAKVSADPDSVESWALLALVLPQLKLLDDAERAAQNALKLNPNFAIALRAMAIIRIRQQRLSEAITLAETAMSLSPDCAHTMVVLGIVRMAQQRLDEADSLFMCAIDRAQLAEAYANRALLLLRRQDHSGAISHAEAAVANKPFLANVWQMLGRLYLGIGRVPDAVTALERAVQLEHENPQIWVDLGEVYRVAGFLDKAIKVLEEAATRFPGLAHAWANLGVALQQAGKPDRAKQAYAQALAITPALGDVHNNLGTLYLQEGDQIHAMHAFEDACRYLPGRADLLANLGITALKCGNYQRAMEAICRSLQYQPLPEARHAFVQCVKQVGKIPNDEAARDFLLTAMREPWGRPSDLSVAAVNLLKEDRVFAELVGRTMSAWPARLDDRALFCGLTPQTLSCNSVLQCLLDTMPISDLGLEQLLTTVRRNLLLAKCTDHDDTTGWNDIEASFYCALARQCFIGGHVFGVLPDEMECLSRLRDEICHALQVGGEITSKQIVALAAYYPLHKLPNANLILERAWRGEVNDLLVTVLVEPQEEHGLGAAVPCLTAIDDEISLEVQRQYEENPYPKWTRLPAASGEGSVEDYIRQLFGETLRVASRRFEGAETILIAGCGAGQHSIETAQRFRKAKILAIDLSRTSLGYAIRKSKELGLDNIDYAQADIMRFGGVDARYDAIESVGVLHHLLDPYAGWKILCGKLKPGGFMRLGLYSEKARQDIVLARNWIEANKFQSTEADIRACRQQIISLPADDPVRQIVNRRDFFELNSCRDLLFHCQEHRFTLPQIKKMLEGLGLIFLGFTLESPTVEAAYRARFPLDKQMENLETWDIFEQENPATFRGMYQFWVQKPG